MLKFVVQTFYQSLFSNSFPFSNFPLAIIFPSESFPHQKAQSKRQEPKKPPKQGQKPTKQKPHTPLQQVFLYPVVNREELQFSGRDKTLQQEKPVLRLASLNTA
jgi:hypothetical protein